MKTSSVLFVTIVAGIGSLEAQPVIGDDGVFNNASYIFSALPNSGIAQGSIFAVFGQGLGPASLQQATSFPLPTELGGTSIKVTVGGTTVNAIILYTVAGQVGAILPSNTPVGDGTIAVTFGGRTSAPAKIRVVRSAFGIFTLNQGGSGPGVVTNTDFGVNLITDAFQPDQIGIIWGTGQGPVSGNEAAGPLPGADPGIDVEVFIGGQRAQVVAKGRSGCCAGLDQIAFRVPRGVEGCFAPVLVRTGGAGGVVSNHATMAVSSRGKFCSDPHGFSASDLERLGGGGVFKTGTVLLSRSSIKFSAPPPVGDVDFKSDNGSGSFFKFDFGKLIRSTGVSGYAPFGSCIVTTFRGQGGANPVLPDPLDAGPVLNLSGPKGNKQLTRQSPGIYSATLGGGGIPGFGGGQPDYLDPGTYTVDNGSSGGADVGPFRAQLNLPTLLTWTNRDSITNVPRTQGLNITWSGGDPNREFVTIIGTSSRSNPTVGAVFICTERASALRFTVPPEVLSALPPSEQQQDTPTGSLSVGSSPLFDPSKFTAPGLDAAYFLYNVFSSKNVNFQ